jgi:exopolysaccharide biosynthesis protein
VRCFAFVGLSILVFAQCLGSEKIRPEYRIVEPGLEYARVAMTNFGVTNIPWSMHIARWEWSRKNFELMATLAKGHIQGLGTVAEQAGSIKPEIGRAVAAVNGDFFVIKAGPYQGDPQGLQIVNGEIVSAPGQVSLWVERRRPNIAAVASHFQVLWPDGGTTPIGLNESPTGKVAVLFTPTFGGSTRATNFLELVLAKETKEKDWLPLRPNRSYRARIAGWNTNGNSVIAKEQMILTLNLGYNGTSVSEPARTNERETSAPIIEADWTNHLAKVRVGTAIEIATALSKNLRYATTAVGGWPLLLADGNVQTRSSNGGKDSYLIPRHPRTAVGYNRKYLYLVEVDGRQPGLSMGMNFEELANLMKDLGCTDAMNLDGGGSATFWLEGRVMNSPSDKHEREVANALVVVEKRQPPAIKLQRDTKLQSPRGF